MHTSSLVVETAQQLAAAGHHAEVVAYLRARGRTELEDSPSLALLYGTAQARLGRHDEGFRWLDLAVDQARRGRDDAVERRALNARGAAAFVSGRIDEAADYFTQALMRASRDGDFVMTGRCSNNLGIISNLRGRYAEAIGSWQIAVAAFHQAGGATGASAAPGRGDAGPRGRLARGRAQRRSADRRPAGTGHLHPPWRGGRNPPSGGSGLGARLRGRAARLARSTPCRARVGRCGALCRAAHLPGRPLAGGARTVPHADAVVRHRA